MIRLAGIEDEHLVHAVMMSAFEEYRHIDIPSSALSETASFVQELLTNNHEKALLYMNNDVPIGSARFKLNKHSIYFSRLSVCPEERGKGIAKSMLSWLEAYAQEYGKKEVCCRTRMSVPKNIKLYESVGYEICGEEVVTKPNGDTVKTVFMKKKL
ncbi:GNAT family N-acetyltransferase [Bacillus taeanensis]|uniref:GNAT family N-acetyltransferase n=1 Tax=Bacillus taeanensis TaxID=273032 RepID=A0A366XMH6_9BACI|nr:GNAT family N-acetyltransferase [Bacillus taeanensis]RBW67560.1 GNAT family N-acetyltransferase [Bacillus taeanensis]